MPVPCRWRDKCRQMAGTLSVVAACCLPDLAGAWHHSARMMYRQERPFPRTDAGLGSHKRWRAPEGYMPHARPVLRSTVPVPAPPLFEYVSPNATDIWTGEGFSRLKPDDIPVFIMEALRNDVDSGLKSTWQLFGDTSRHIFKDNFTDFVECAQQTAREFSTSFYGAALHGTSYEIETAMNFVNAQSTDPLDPNCWIATQVIKTISADGRMRRWQWELRKRRRPPGRETWFVESIGSSDKDGNFEPKTDTGGWLES